jgi:hypothetical protein
MTCHSLAKITLSALLVTLGGCKDSGLPVEPSAPPLLPGEPPAPPAPTAPQNFPVPSSAASLYDRTSPSVFDGNSRYVIYENGTFSLQYVSPVWGFFEYPGRYSRTDSAITFQFDANGGAFPSWLADGIVAGDSLTVKYNHDMLMSDFEDGTYTQLTSGSSNVTGG